MKREVWIEEERIKKGRKRECDEKGRVGDRVRVRKEKIKRKEHCGITLKN
jgi:hypothetical protein